MKKCRIPGRFLTVGTVFKDSHDRFFLSFVSRILFFKSFGKRAFVIKKNVFSIFFVP